MKKLATSGVEVLFLQNKAVSKKDGVVIATASMKDNLYELSIKVNESIANICQIDQNEPRRIFYWEKVVIERTTSHT